MLPVSEDFEVVLVDSVFGDCAEWRIGVEHLANRMYSALAVEFLNF